MVVKWIPSTGASRSPTTTNYFEAIIFFDPRISSRSQNIRDNLDYTKPLRLHEARF